MQINKNKAAAINYTLTDESNKVLDKSENGEFVYLHGADNIIPGLEKALEGKVAGDEVQVTVQPDDAYGETDPAQIQPVPREMFPEDSNIEVGMQFHAQSPEGEPIVVTIAEINDKQILVDGNHPMAGLVLNFDVKIISVREATEDELAHGHIHGEGGCGH